MTTFLFVLAVVVLGFALRAVTRRKASLLTATITPCKCDNPDHKHGCGLGWHLIECAEDEAHIWVATIAVDDVSVWGSNQTESRSRETATAALLKRLAEGAAVVLLVRWLA